jgi:hypothetical protein
VSKLDAWILVGSQIWWFIKWPLLCFSWYCIGRVGDVPGHTASLLIVGALIITVLVSNG